LILVYIVLGAVAILLLVTRAASRRDAVRKAELARQAPPKTDDGSDVGER
jgi:hypothetical protein